MGFLSRLHQPSRFRADAGSGYPPDSHPWWYGDAGAGWSTSARVSPDLALTIPPFWRAVRILAENVASFQGRVHERLGPRANGRPGGNAPSPDHPYDYTLGRSPNQDLTAFEFWETAVVHIILRGRAYALKRFVPDVDRGRMRLELWPLHPDRVKKHRVPDGRVVYAVQTENAGRKNFTADEVFHLRGMSLDGLDGASMIAYASGNVSAMLAAEGFAQRFFKHGVSAAVQAVHPNTLGEEGLDNLRKSIQAYITGLENAYGVYVGDEGVELKPIGVEPEKAQLLLCTTPDALVTMADGTLRRVDALAEGDSVLGWDHASGKLLPSRVERVADNGAQPLIRIRTHRGRELVTTLNHPYLASKRLRCDKCGNYHEHGKSATGLKPLWIRADELRVGDYVAAEHDVTWTGTGELSFDDGYLIGAMVGDGSIRKKNSMAFSNQDPGVLVAVGASLSGRFKARLNYRSGVDYEIVGGNRMGRPAVGREREHNPARAFFADLGLLGSDCYTKRVPEAVIKSGQEAVAGFVSGYLDTDGSVNRLKAKQPVVTWTSASQGLISDLQHCLALLGVQASIKKEQFERGATGFGPAGKKTRFTCIVAGRRNIERLADRVQLHNAKKAARLAGWAAQGAPRERPDFQTYDRITEIELLPAGPTVAVTVADTHSHVTNGLITHNTREFTAVQVANWCGLPPGMLGDSKTPTFASSKQFRQDLVDITFRPLTERLEARVDVDLLAPSDPDPMRYFWKFEMDALLRGDASERSAIHERNIRAGWETRNEARLVEDMEPLDGLDEPIVALNLGSGRAPADGQGQARITGDQLRTLAVAQHLVRKEQARASALAQRHADDGAAWAEALEQFYGEHAREVSERLCLPLAVAREYAARQGLRLRERGIRACEDWHVTVAPDLANLALHREAVTEYAARELAAGEAA